MKKNWPVNDIKWKNQLTFTRKQVKKNKQITLAKLGPAEETTSKDEVELLS